MTAMLNKNTQPLVSVGIITYNSSKYVLEALESVYNQTYQNIELIVSDDCSKDDTVQIVEKWLHNKSSRFVETKLLTVEYNTGTTKNCNRLLRACKGEFIKSFAGDDVLLPDAIEKYVSFVINRPAVKWVFAKAIRYNGKISDDCIMQGVSYKMVKSFAEMSQKDQFRRLVIFNYLWYPTHFFSRSLLESIGGYDESFGIYEDYPNNLKLYRKGEKSYFLDEYTLGYRYTDHSVVNNPGFIINRNIRKLAFVARKKFALDKLSWVEVFGTYILYGLDMFFSVSFLNKRTKFRECLTRHTYNKVYKLCFLLQKYVKA